MNNIPTSGINKTRPSKAKKQKKDKDRGNFTCFNYKRKR